MRKSLALFAVRIALLSAAASGARRGQVHLYALVKEQLTFTPDEHMASDMCCFYMPAQRLTARPRWAAGEQVCHLPQAAHERAAAITEAREEEEEYRRLRLQHAGERLAPTERQYAFDERAENGITSSALCFGLPSDTLITMNMSELTNALERSSRASRASRGSRSSLNTLDTNGALSALVGGACGANEPPPRAPTPVASYPTDKSVTVIARYVSSSAIECLVPPRLPAVTLHTLFSPSLKHEHQRYGAIGLGDFEVGSSIQCQFCSSIQCQFW